MLRAIIFDMDGVILDSERLWNQMAHAHLRSKGKEFDSARSKHHLSGRSMLEASRILKEHYGLEESPEEITRERIALVKELYREHLAFIKGFPAFLERAHARGLLAAVATGSNYELLAAVQERLPIDDLFPGRIYSSDDVGGKGKPDPALFLYAARQLNVPPAECLVIEDAPNGIEAARRAGMRVVGIATSFPHELLKDATIVVDSFAEIDLDAF